MFQTLYDKSKEGQKGSPERGEQMYQTKQNTNMNEYQATDENQDNFRGNQTAFCKIKKNIQKRQRLEKLEIPSR